MPRNGINLGFMTWVQHHSQALIAHLYQFDSLSGDSDFFCDLDVSLTLAVDNGLGTQIWKGQSLRFSGMRRKTSVGVEVDEQTLKIGATPTDTLFGDPFLTGAGSGLLDGCLITRYRAVWAHVTGNWLIDVSKYPPVKTWVMFKGYTSAIAKAGASHVEVTVKSPMVQLQRNMPRNYYQPACLWVLYDTGCTLTQADFLVSGAVAAGMTTVTIPVAGGVPNPTGADGLPTYAGGQIEFFGGVNDGLLSVVETNDSNNLYMWQPLPALPAVGDEFQYYPGCSKTFNTCNLKFDNTANFRGFDKVPPMQVSI